jgi:carboxylesterase
MKIGFESKKGPVGVLLIHGLSGTPDEMKPLGDFLSEKDFSVLGPWLKGHDTTPRDLAKTDWTDWAASAREAYDHLKAQCDQIYVGGLSMGGLQALHLAAQVPVAGVIAMSTPIRIDDFRFNGIAFFRFLQWWTSNLTGGILDPQAPPHLTHPYVMTKSLYDLKKLMDLVRAELPQVKVPALVAQGRKDSMVPPGNAQLVHQWLGSTQKDLLYLDRSDHVVTMDFDKQILFERVFKFLTEGAKTQV